MAHRNSITLVVISLLLLIPLFCEAFDQHERETEDPGSGEAEGPRINVRPGYGAIPDAGEEEEEDDENQSAVTGGQDPEETDEHSTLSPGSVAGKDTIHLPRETEVDESDETTTLVSSAVPLAPVPSEEEEEEEPQQPPHNDTLSPEPSHKIVIWDGAGEPGRELSHSQTEEPASQPEQPRNKPEHPTPVSQELQGGSNGNGHTKDDVKDEVHKPSSNEPQHIRPGGKPVPVTSSGSASSSSMAWIVVFAVVSSALLISGVILAIVIVSDRSKRKTSKGAMSDFDADKVSSCHHGCRHNFAEFNPYAWPPTPVSRNEISLRPVT